VPGKQATDAGVGTHLREQSQAFQVFGETTVRMGNERSTATENGVAGEHVIVEDEADTVGTVTGRFEYAQLTTVHLDQLLISETACGERANGDAQ
jgi:hypothetical protein